MSDGVLHHFHEEDDEDPVLLTHTLPWIRARMGSAMFGSDAVLAASIDPREGVPRDGGIYFLIWDDLIVYVGQASCILDRIRQHAIEKRFIDRVAFICGIPHWWRTEIEHAYIKAWSPPWNAETRRCGSLRELPDLQELAGSLDRSAVAKWHTPAMQPCSERHSWPVWRQHILGRIQHLHPEQNVVLSDVGVTMQGNQRVDGCLMYTKWPVLPRCNAVLRGGCTHNGRVRWTMRLGNSHLRSAP